MKLNLAALPKEQLWAFAVFWFHAGDHASTMAQCALEQEEDVVNPLDDPDECYDDYRNDLRTTTGWDFEPVARAWFERWWAEQVQG